MNIIERMGEYRKDIRAQLADCAGRQAQLEKDRNFLNAEIEKYEQMRNYLRDLDRQLSITITFCEKELHSEKV